VTEMWREDSALAAVTIEDGIGILRVSGLVDSAVVAAMRARVVDWALVERPIGYVVVYGWEAVLTSQGITPPTCDDALRHLPAAILVPPERLMWACRHCEILGARGLFRAPFVDQAQAVAWIRRLAPALQGPCACEPRSSSAALPEHPSLWHADRSATSNRARRAARRSPPLVEGPGSLSR
jgi:hypothetical protein